MEELQRNIDFCQERSAQINLIKLLKKQKIRTTAYHHILESSGSDNKKLPPQRVDSIKVLERSHARPTEVTENIEALIIKTCKIRYHTSCKQTFK